jgi:hypothetical protein
MTGTHQILVYIDDINKLGENRNNIRNNTEAVLEASREVGLEADTKKTKYKVVSHQQYGG